MLDKYACNMTFSTHCLQSGLLAFL